MNFFLLRVVNTMANLQATLRKNWKKIALAAVVLLVIVWVVKSQGKRRGREKYSELQSREIFADEYSEDAGGEEESDDEGEGEAFESWDDELADEGDELDSEGLTDEDDEFGPDLDDEYDENDPDFLDEINDDDEPYAPYATGVPLMQPTLGPANAITPLPMNWSLGQQPEIPEAAEPSVLKYGNA